MPKLSEAAFSRQIQDFLALDNWRIFRMEPVSDRSRGRGFGELGMPDLLCIRYFWYDRLNDKGGEGDIKRRDSHVSEVMWLEIKVPGGKVSPHQKNWQVAERWRGARALIAGEDFPATWEGFTAFYRTSGLMRRPGLC